MSIARYAADCQPLSAVLRGLALAQNSTGVSLTLGQSLVAIEQGFGSAAPDLSSAVLQAEPPPAGGRLSAVQAAGTLLMLLHNYRTANGT